MPSLWRRWYHSISRDYQALGVHHTHPFHDGTRRWCLRPSRLRFDDFPRHRLTFGHQNIPHRGFPFRVRLSYFRLSHLARGGLRSDRSTVDRRQAFSPFCQIFRLRPFEVPRHQCPPPRHKACIHISIPILVLSRVLLILERRWRRFVHLAHPRRSQQRLAHGGQQGSIPRHGEFGPPDTPHVCHVGVLFLRRRIDHNQSFAPMTNG